MEDGYHIDILRSQNRFGDLIRIGVVRNGIICIAQPMELIFRPYNPGEQMPVAIELPYDGDRLLDAFRSAINQHHGIPEGHAEGELKATKEHLKDMKTILFNQFRIKEVMPK